MRLPMMALLLLIWPAVVFGQAKPEDENKVSNDNPARPLQMPPASTEVKEGIDDFERFRRRGAWERALKALYTIPEAQATRFVDGENGFIIPVARKRRSFLANLPPEGQAAYRLFYDAEAQKLMDEAVGASEQKNLERLYSAYFTSSVGDDAADRLGDLYFELGQFDRAADCWLAVLRDRPDTNLSPGLIAVKAAVALSRAGRRSEFEQVRGELTSRYADEKPTLGGRTAAPAELLKLLLDESPSVEVASSAANKDGSGLDLTGPVDPAWQMRFAESIEAGMTRQEHDQWNSNFLSGAVPAGAIDGKILFLNYLGYILALDLESGKLLWRTGSFHNLELQANQPSMQMLDTSRLAVVASGEHVWTLARDHKDQNYFSPYQLTCRRVDNGEVVWKSSDLPDYAQLDFTGPPLLADGKLFIAAKTNWNPQQRQGQSQQIVLALRPHDGKLLWRTEVAISRQGQPMYWYSYSRETSPQPMLVYRAGSIYVDTHLGVLAKLDADSGTCDWGYGYKTATVQSSYRFFYYYQPQEPQALGGKPMRSGEAFLIKGMQSDRLYAVEPNRMQVLWERPIAKATRLLGVDDDTIYLGGAELSALDIRTRKLTWATRVPKGSLEGHVLVRPEGLWQLTPRGIFEIDPKSGDVRRIFRGNDLGSAGGDLLLTDRWLLAVSNRAITAYPRQPARAEVSARLDERTPTGAISP